MPCASRSQGMSLAVIRPDDIQAGAMKRRFVKDFDFSLTTADIMGDTTRKVWATSASPAKPCGEKAKMRPERRPPRETHQDVRIAHVAPATPAVTYTPPEERWDPHGAALKLQATTSGQRNTLDVSDIAGTFAAPLFPKHRTSPREPASLQCELEFRSKALIKEATVAARRASGQCQPPDCRPDDVAPKPRLPGREAGPLNPRYIVPLASELPGTSLHACWAEEKGSALLYSTATAVAPAEIGFVKGSAPKGLPFKTEPSKSLETSDVAGATTIRKIGGMAFSMYGPHGNRPAMSTNLNTADIPGAQADTHRVVRSSRLAANAGAAIVGTPRENQRCLSPLAAT